MEDIRNFVDEWKAWEEKNMKKIFEEKKSLENRLVALQEQEKKILGKIPKYVRIMDFLSSQETMKKCGNEKIYISTSFTNELEKYSEEYEMLMNLYDFHNCEEEIQICTKGKIKGKDGKDTVLNIIDNVLINGENNPFFYDENAGTLLNLEQFIGETNCSFFGNSDGYCPGKCVSDKDGFVVRFIREKISYLKLSSLSNVVKTNKSDYFWYNDALSKFVDEYYSRSGAWKDFFGLEEVNAEIQKISLVLKKEAQERPLIPDMPLVFNAFDCVPPGCVKVIILGLDPYPDSEQAMGASFSIPKGVKVPASLRNIFKELQSEGFSCDSKNGNLEKWMKEGVFLYNTALTIPDGIKKSGYHCKLWAKFTELCLEYIFKSNKYVVGILWGREAQKYASIFKKFKNDVIIGGHPSPLNTNGDFLGSKPFSSANNMLKKHNVDIINWNL